MNITQLVAEHIVRTEYKDLPAKTLERIRVQVIDSVGVIASSIHAPSIDSTVALMRRLGGEGEASVLFHNLRIPAHQAAFVNSLMMRSFDFGMITSDGPNNVNKPDHASESVVPAAFAAAEAVGASGEEFVTALAVGNDIAARLAYATGGRYGGSFGNTGTLNGLASVGIASKLFKLDVQQTRDAFGLALAALGGTADGVGDSVTSFKLPVALASRNGIFSAQLALGDFSSNTDAINGKSGYFALFGGGTDTPETILDGLGEVFYADCEIKPWPGCRATHTAATCAAKMIEKEALDSSQIVEVIIRQPESSRFVGKRLGDGRELLGDALFSVRFAVCCLLAKGELKAKNESMEYFNDPEIRRLHDKTEIIYSDSKTTSVEVKLADGSTRIEEADRARGHIVFDPLPFESVLEKYWDNIGFAKALPKEKAQEAIDMILRIEELSDFRSLVSLLA